MKTDDATLREAESRSSRERPEWKYPGIPVTAVEERDMQHRVKLQAAVDPLVAAIDAERSETDGLWIDQQRGGKVIVNLTASADEAKYRALVARHFRYPDEVLFQRVSRSRLELQAMHDRILADRDHLLADGFKVASFGFPAGRNVVEIEVEDLTPEQADELRRRYPGTDVVEGSYPGD